MKKRTCAGAWAVLLWAFGLASPAGAQNALESYALVIGSNQGGPGQEPLRYAERDAARFAELLSELGRTPTQHVQLLLSPDRVAVEASLQTLRAELALRRDQGQPTRLLFYYSGHARADAANLADDSLPLGELREALASLPSTLTLVVLDACQSGAFSGVKGASPAADFSFNSVEQLDAEGMVVMASSTGSELSQESSRLGAGYFTHHLMAAMRGAGDRNDDGRVSLDEAYRYAYERTLADTSRTRVGGQHVTLEMNVKGQGDVPLTYTEDASATLGLARALTGTVLVQQKGQGAVMAEVVKTPSAPLHLALPPGSYDVVVRQSDAVFECDGELGPGDRQQVDLRACQRLSLDEWRAKGTPPPPPHEKWFIETGFGWQPTPQTAYTERLNEFGFEESSGILPRLFVRVSGGLMINRHVGFSLSYQRLESRGFNRSFNGPSGPSNRDSFVWTAHRLAAGLRLARPLVGRWLVLYGDATVGVTLAPTELEDETQERDSQLEFGPGLDAVVGLQTHFGRRFGLFLEGGYGWTPVPESRLGDRHNAAGGRIVVGMRLRGEGNWR